METATAEARAKALEALKLAPDATDEQIANTVEALHVKVAEAVSALGLNGKTEEEKVAAVATADPELLDLIKRFVDVATVPLQRRAQEAHQGFNSEAYEKPTKIMDVLRGPVQTDWQQDLHNIQTEMHIVGALTCKIDWDQVDARKGLDPLQFERLAGTKVWNRYLGHIAKGPYEGLKAGLSVGGSTGYGPDFVATDTSPQLVEQVRLAPGIHRLFDVIPMPTSPYVLPFNPGPVTTYIFSEITANWGSGSAPTGSTGATDKRTLTAKDHGCLIPFSSEFDEDSVIPVVPWLTSTVVESLALGRDDIVLNGDITATHMDGDVTGSGDVRKSFKGARKSALANSAVVSMGTVNATAFRQVLDYLGDYAANGTTDCAWAVNTHGHNHMLGLDIVQTVEKYGPQAGVITGQVNYLYGIPVYKSSKVRNNLNATGVYETAGIHTKTAVYCFSRKAFFWGDRRSVRIKLVAAPWGIEQVAIYGSERICLAESQTSTTNGYPCALGYNLANTIS